MYGVPEAVFGSIEQQNTEQFYKCIDCALEGVDEHINFLYLVKGTLLCLRHAKVEREPIKFTPVSDSGPWNV